MLADVDVNACIKKSSENFVHEVNCNYLPDVTFLFFSFSLNDAIDFLMNTEDNSNLESSSDEDDHGLVWLCCLQLKKQMLRLTWTVMHQMI